MLHCKAPLVITGFKSSGKSTIGRMLALETGREFLDLDQVLVDLFEDHQGEWLTFREIYQRVGAERFRRWEYEAARSVVEHKCDYADGLVLALGGGTLMHPPTRELLAGFGKTVYLRVPFKTIVSRIKRKGWPAYVQDEEDPGKALERILREREPVYMEAADVVVQLPGRWSKSRTLEAVMQALRESVAGDWTTLEVAQNNGKED